MTLKFDITIERYHKLFATPQGTNVQITKSIHTTFEQEPKCILYIFNKNLNAF